MIEFKKWIEHNIGTDLVQSQIDQIYNKAKYAIQIVQMYSKSTGKKLLYNISTIVPLNSSVYGLYNSKENKKIIGPNIANKIKFKFGQEALNGNIQKLPQNIIKQYLPDIDEKQILPSDIIHVNVAKIVRELGDSKQTVIEIASTIVHEATHAIEFQSTGKTDEVTPVEEEKLFKVWVDKNWNSIISKIPALKF